MVYIDKLKQFIQRQTTVRVIGYTLVLLLLQSIVVLSVFRYFSVRDIEHYLMNLTQRVEEGLSYRNGSWDTTRYTSDPNTPHPSGSSGFSTPLYIIGVDGFVIERNAPIKGLLDTADFNHLMAFQTPQTIKIITNEQWRILSRPIITQGKTRGVIVVSVYNPNTPLPADLDDKLARNIDYIASKVSVKGEELSASAVDIRSIDYDVSFEVVTSFNRVLLNNGRMPTYIDESYVYDELRKKKTVRIYKDPDEHKQYLIASRVLYDSAHTPVGIVMAGESIQHVNDIIMLSIPVSLVTMILLVVCSGYFCISMQKDIFQKAIAYNDTLRKSKSVPSAISFNKRNGALSIDRQTLEIPYASNQYYLCKAVFSDPRKRWEVDELLELFGHEPAAENWRKVYDSMILLNKRVEPYMSVKLIELRDKTYRLNPELRFAVSRAA